MNCLQQPLFQENQYEHSCVFMPTLVNIVRNKWSDFDHHRNKMAEILSKIKNIKWYTVDSDKYDEIIIATLKRQSSGMPFLTSSRYYHSGKCYPSYHECFKCFKYNCIHCGEGSNSMYGGKCSERSRCSKLINFYPKLTITVNKPRRIYLFENNEFHYFYLHKNSLCSKDIYGL